MLITKKLLFICIILFNPYSMVVAASFDCAKMLAKLEACGASHSFGYTYELICKEGAELTPHDITEILQAHDLEIQDNRCLAKIYLLPKTNRKQRDKDRKELEQWEREEFKRKRNEKQD